MVERTRILSGKSLQDQVPIFRFGFGLNFPVGCKTNEMNLPTGHVEGSTGAEQLLESPAVYL